MEERKKESKKERKKDLHDLSGLPRTAAYS